MARHNLVCLLPARNGESDLPDYFTSVRRFADAVVALDDGSTDGTAALLKARPWSRSCCPTRNGPITRLGRFREPSSAPGSGRLA